MRICAHPGCPNTIPKRTAKQRGRTPKFCEEHRQKRSRGRQYPNYVPQMPRCEHGKAIGQCQMRECQPVVYLAGVVQQICQHLRLGLETVGATRPDRAFFLEQIAEWEHVASCCVNRARE